MDYILKNQFGEVIVVRNHQIEKINTSLDLFLNHLLERRFSSLEATLKSVKRNLGISCLTPLYVDSKTLLFPVSGRRSHFTIYLNYFQISHIETYQTNQVIISFKNNHQMILSSRRTVNYALTKCEKIVRYLNDANSK